MEREDWDARYGSSDLVWGTEPNRFVASAFGEAPAAGRVLDLACGEGRNAIWLATRGATVTAVDFSGVAIERARSLAERAGVDVDWRVDDVVQWRAPARDFDLVLISYLQIPMAPFGRVLDHAAAALRPGGEVFLIGHAVENLTDGVGGPQDARVLWEAEGLGEMLEELGLGVQRCENVERPVAGRDDSRCAIDVLARATRR
jgi:SAM-dependent methyltransferase